MARISIHDLTEDELSDHALRRVVAGFRLTISTTESARYEIYDYPGEYAQRFDGIDRGGGG